MAFDLKQRIAHLRGLASAESGDTAAGPDPALVSGILEVLAELADSVDATRLVQAEIAEQVDELANDMTELAEEVMGDIDSAAECWEITCPGCGRGFTATGAALEDDEVELVCPECGRVMHDFDVGLDSDEDGDETIDRR